MIRVLHLFCTRCSVYPNSFLFLADGTCDGVQCHVNATCFKPSGEKPGQCVCKGGWQGDGRTCEGQKKGKLFAL